MSRFPELTQSKYQAQMLSKGTGWKAQHLSAFKGEWAEPILVGHKAPFSAGIIEGPTEQQMKGKQQPSIRDPGFSGFCVPFRRLRGNDTPGPLGCAIQSPGNAAQRAEHPGPVNPSLAPQTPWSGFYRGGGHRFKDAQRACESDFIKYHHTGPSFRVLASGSCKHAQEGPACQPWSLVVSKEKSCMGPHNPERAEQDIPAQPRCTWILKARCWVWGACSQREYLFRGESKTNKALPFASAQISARSYMFLDQQWEGDSRTAFPPEE